MTSNLEFKESKEEDNYTYMLLLLDEDFRPMKYGHGRFDTEDGATEEGKRNVAMGQRVSILKEIAYAVNKNNRADE